ncbi:DUF397 domain-containing protein [Streptomyces sp. NPDC023723]|uniref:DUF397 domain-containing protein n=1 Tax=Streptomyces sp. NPDC023723 TaxID=3154323 RepID=UPI0033D70DCD
MNPYIERASTAGLEWVKSSYSGNNGNCIEVAALPGSGRALRDSKVPDGPALAFAAAEFDAFVQGVLDGEFRRA